MARRFNRVMYAVMRIPGRKLLVVNDRSGDFGSVERLLRASGYKVQAVNESDGTAWRNTIDRSTWVVLRCEVGSVGTRDSQDDAQSRFTHLSPREREVFFAVTDGLLNKQVAYNLGISEKTVKIHRRNVMDKMHAESLPALVRMADRVRELEPELADEIDGVGERESFRLHLNSTRLPA